MTGQNQDLDLTAINARLARDRRHWWTRWYVMRGGEIATIGAVGFGFGLAVGIVLMMGGH